MRGPRGAASRREEEPDLPQWQGWGRSLGAVPIRAAVRRGREEGSPAGALDPARGHLQPPLQHRYGQGGELSRAGKPSGAGRGGAGEEGSFSPATVSWLSTVGSQ